METMSPGDVTIIVAAITVAEAAGAAIAARLSAATVRGQWLLVGCGAMVIGTSAVIPWSVATSAVALSIILGLALPLRATLLQRLSADRTRARVASLASACDMACSALALSLAGGWRSRRRS
jgi:hypothetical protein